jgi:hypothetical protein
VTSASDAEHPNRLIFVHREGTRVRERRFGRRLGATAAVAAAAVAAFAVIGGTGLAGGLANPGQAQYGAGGQYHGKVTICHKGWVTIRVAWAAWPAHRDRHGDTMGPCSAAAVKAGKLKAAKLKAAKLNAKQHGKKNAKQHGKKTDVQKAAAKAEKKAKHTAAPSHESSTSDNSDTSQPLHGPPPGHGNGQGNGNGHGKNV